MPPCLTHIALHVADLEACIAFYSEVCGLEVVHQRPNSAGDSRVVWMAAPGRGREFVIVLLPGGPGAQRAADDFSHLGYAVASRAEVERFAEIGRRRGCLAVAPVAEPYPVGYFCCLTDPDGNMVEFSYGQPLGPGAEAADGAAPGAA
jgi:catechol 2,3-dioxygenase-like lactoylglutathione lyase family enzyme